MSTGAVEHARTPRLRNPYDYIPSEVAAIAIITVFGVSTLLHIGQAVYWRKWWIFPTIVLCGALEILGWAGRLWSHSEVWNISPFQMQITCLILAPTPLLAASFVIFGQIINKLGAGYSRLTPKYYTIVFCSCDVIALVVQGIGGGVASSASNSGKSVAPGSNIMLAGIIFQLVVIIVFAICAVEYVVRYVKDRPLRSPSQDTLTDATTGRGEFTSPVKTMLWGLTFSTLVLLIRAIYRTIELADGWDGKIMATEHLFIVLDGVMIVLAIYTLNVVLPFWFVAERRAVSPKTY